MDYKEFIRHYTNILNAGTVTSKGVEKYVRKEMDEIRKQNFTYNWRIEMLEDGYKSLSKQIFYANGKIATRASHNSVDALYKHVGETEKQQTDFNRSFSRAIRRVNRSKK